MASSTRNAARALAVREARAAIPEVQRILTEHHERIMRGGGGPECKCQECISGRLILAALKPKPKRKR